MSLSQKFSGFSIVPWYNSAEWKRVYQLIFVENPSVDKQTEALNILILWKQRMNFLPSGVEGTLYILEALLIDQHVISERQCCTFCCASIMRFLNICVANRCQVYSFTKTAKSHKIPDWIINIRHDFAHSPKPPSFSLLKLALDECFKWLKHTYWDPESLIIKDYIIEKETCDNNKNEQGFAIIKLIANLIVWLNEDYPLPHDLSEELKNFDLNHVDIDNFPEVMNELFNNLGDSCVDDEKWSDLIKDLILSGCFYFYPKTETEKKSTYTFKYTSKLIVHLQINNNLVYLISELLRLVNDKNELESNRFSVSYWLNEIFIGMLKSRRSNMKIDVNELTGKGIRFQTMPNNIYNEVMGFRGEMFENLDEVHRKCFHSFMLVCNQKNVKEWNAFFNRMKNSGGKFGWQNLQECDDFVDLSKCKDSCMSNFSINETLVADSNETIQKEPSKERKKRWTLITDVNFARCPLGVHPYTIQSPKELC